MLKFTVLDGKVVPDPTLLMTEEFRNIIDSYEEDHANNMLLYIFWCCDLSTSNPHRDVDYRLKEKGAFDRAFGKGKKGFTKQEQIHIDAGIDAYNFFNETSLERATMSYDQKIDEVRTLLDTIKPESHPFHRDDLCSQCAGPFREIEKYVSNVDVISKFSKQLNEMATLKLRAMETAKKIENTGRVRGKGGSSLIERGVFRKK